jgi:hypothetical protein
MPTWNNWEDKRYEKNAFGDQGALFEKTAPWTPAKTFHCPSGGLFDSQRRS